MALISLKPRQDMGFSKRLSFFMYFFYFILTVIAFRFFWLQIISGDEYRELSQGRTEQEYPLIPPRGLVYDRNGVLLAKNKASFSLSLITAYLPKGKKNREKRHQLYRFICKEFDLSYDWLVKKIIQHTLHNYSPLLLKENLTKKQLLFLEENRSTLPFLNITEYSGRIYPFGESTSHILGYIGIANKKELKKIHKQGYNKKRQTVVIGKSGIERQYDKLLRGVEGESVKIVNAVGRPIRTLPSKAIPAVPGKNVILSIDAALQDLAYNILYGRKGVIVVTRPINGEVLALVSSPGYDANLFLNPETRKKVYLKLLRNKNKPFLNRAIQGRYPSGSIFKIVTAIAGLEDEKLNPYEKVDCRKGYFELGDRKFKDWKTHGVEDLFSALEKSVNVYFYKLGYALGYASIKEHARKLALHKKTLIDIPGETHGFIPNPDWKEKRFKQPWYDGDTVNAAIGQGFISLTPIGANNIISIIAAGKIYQPRILWKIKSPYTGIIEKEFRPKLLSQFRLSKKNLEYIREGLRRVPLTGTATYHKYLSKVPIAGKTGSAQNGNVKTHSWFVSYGPLNKKLQHQVAITVLVERAGHGGSVAVPIASVLYNFIEGKMNRDKALKTIYQIFKYQESRK